MTLLVRYENLLVGATSRGVRFMITTKISSKPIQTESANNVRTQDYLNKKKQEEPPQEKPKKQLSIVSEVSAEKNQQNVLQPQSANSETFLDLLYELRKKQTDLQKTVGLKAYKSSSEQNKKNHIFKLGSIINDQAG